MLKLSLLLLYSVFTSIECQQLQWYLITDGADINSPVARRDAALGYDSQFLILYGGRDQAGMPMQDSYAFNLLIGQWERLDFPNQPSGRYGMAYASALGNGLYVFGGFGLQGSTPNYNPYMAYGSSGLPFYKQNPAGSNNQKVAGTGKQNYYQMNPSGSGNYYNDDDDRADDNFQPLQDGWFLNFATKSWQSFQTFQHARGFGSAAASPFSTGGVPRVIYSMGKSRDWMYSTVESTGQASFGVNQQSFGQSAILMYDLSSYNPQYPHARHGHSTTLLTDNHLLLYGGCLSGYSKGGPCPSTDTWLFHIDRGHWERLWECPTTKTGAAMVTLPSYEMCASLGQGIYPIGPGRNNGNEPPVAVLWGGRERNPSSIGVYDSPEEEVAVFSLSRKEWYLKRAAPSQTGGRYPVKREGAAHVAGCFQGMPGMFIFGGRSVNDRRVLSDLWFLHATSQGALNTPNGRSCIYPYSFYHLHGMFQFFAYGVLFPIGYIVGATMTPSKFKLLIHAALQLLGIALAICGFSFGVHSVRAPPRFHFRHAHGVIGIITFILTIIQLVIGIIGAIYLSSLSSKSKASEIKGSSVHSWSQGGSWRGLHHLLGALIVALGIVNISLGVFLAVLPLPVWIIWFIYMGFLVLLLVGLDILGIMKRRRENSGGYKSQHDSKGSLKPTARDRLPSSDEKLDIGTISSRPSANHSMPPLEVLPRTDRRARPEETNPLLPIERQYRPGDVTEPGRLPEYSRPIDRPYPVSPRKRSEFTESAGFEYYEGNAPGHEQAFARPRVQQQNGQHFQRVQLK